MLAATATASTELATELAARADDRRGPAVVWEPFNAALHSLSLVASPEAVAVADEICDLTEEFTILFHGRQPTDLDELRPIHSGLHQAHLKFVTDFGLSG